LEKLIQPPFFFVAALWQSLTHNNHPSPLALSKILLAHRRCIFLSEDEAKGKAKQAQGKLQKAGGNVKGDLKQAEGKAQEEWGKLKKKL
jgi:hypothetical protein